MEISEKELIELTLRYYYRFGKPFFVGVTECLSSNEIAEGIRKCLKDGKPRRPPRYKPNIIY
jgi:2-oxo-4-hydroxy-4-carboxy--5-ureidoimidazoline (OHCU) decarboxylase